MIEMNLTASLWLKVLMTEQGVEPEFCVIDSNIDLDNTEVVEIPKGLEVDKLHLDNTEVTEIPSDIKVTFLHLDNTNVSEIPEGLEVKFLYLANTKVKEKPAHFKGELYC